MYNIALHLGCQTLCAFGSKLKSQFILLFNLFLLLFMSPTALFGTIHEFHVANSVNFYLYLAKVFSFNKINRFQIDPSRESFSVLWKQENVFVEFDSKKRNLYFDFPYLSEKCKLEISYENIWQIQHHQHVVKLKSFFSFRLDSFKINYNFSQFSAHAPCFFV